MTAVPSQQPLGTEFTAEIYFTAALERANSLRLLYDNEDYVLALYVAGVAVESLFRAFRMKHQPYFDSRHDLTALAKESKFDETVPEHLKQNFFADLGVVVSRWSNSHRYRSAAALSRYLKRAHLHRGIKGNVLKENTRRTINSATDIINLGGQLWKN